nr:hydantoinase/oxoprolinase family protein [Euzebyaceae bacterium]
VGAGGGSIAHVDSGGLLKVGPRSAGAHPGPVCYGLGNAEPTVTDANLALGRLPAAARLGGGLALDLDAAHAALDAVAPELGLDRARLAAGIVAVADSAMANAIREITVRRGIDPRDFALVAFGGAGPLHAAAIAEELDLQRVVVPADPGVLSAWGMLQSDTRHDAVSSFFARVADVDPDTLGGALADLAERARLMLKEDGVEADAIALEPSADLRYAGQEYTVTVGFAAGEAPGGVLATLPDAFADAHKARYGHNNPGEAIEFVNLRMTAYGRVPRPARQTLAVRPHPEPIATGETWFDGQFWPTPVYRREQLGSGTRLDGPAVILEDACTVLVPPDWALSTSPPGHLILTRSLG